MSRGGTELWRATTDGRVLERLTFDPEGRSLFGSHSDGGLERRDARDGSLEWESAEARGRQFAITVHSDGSRVFTGDSDGNVSIFDARDGVLLAVLQEHENYVFELEFDPRREALLSASGDHTVRRWSTRPLGELGEAMAARERALERVLPRLEELRREGAGDLDAVRLALGSEKFEDPLERRVAIQVLDGWAWSAAGVQDR